MAGGKEEKPMAGQYYCQEWLGKIKGPQAKEKHLPWNEERQKKKPGTGMAGGKNVCIKSYKKMLR